MHIYPHSSLQKLVPLALRILEDPNEKHHIQFSDHTKDWRDIPQLLSLVQDLTADRCITYAGETIIGKISQKELILRILEKPQEIHLICGTNTTNSWYDELKDLNRYQFSVWHPSAWNQLPSLYQKIKRETKDPSTLPTFQNTNS